MRQHQRDINTPHREQRALSDDGKVDGQEKRGGVGEGKRKAGFGAQMAQRLSRTPETGEGGQSEQGAEGEEQGELSGLW